MRVRFTAAILLFVFVVPQFAISQTRTVSPSELRQAIESASLTRQKNLDQVRSFFASNPARQALNSAKLDYRKVQNAVATLNPDELARLSERTRSLQADFAAGALSNQELTYVVIALAAAVVVLVVVAA